MITAAVFDSKPYDEKSFNLCAVDGIRLKFIESKLNVTTAELAKGCQAVVLFVQDKCDSEVVDKLYSLGVRLVALRCAGYDNVDVKSCFGKLHVVRVPSYSPEAVAEHAAALLLTSVRHINKAYNRTRESNFSLVGLTGRNLCGKRVGIFGMGRIGFAFAKICQGFGMHVMSVDPNKPEYAKGVEFVDTDELLEKADIISLNCPLTDDNRHMLNRSAFRKMKDGVIIVNTSRGALIDSEALIEALKCKKVSACCLDVYEEESDVFYEDVSSEILSDDTLSRLLSMPNVIITSHQAFLTEEALAAIAETTISNLTKYFFEDTLDNEICYHCGRITDCRKKRSQKCF